MNAKKRHPKTSAEDLLAWHLRAAEIGHEREYRFHPVRRWRADFRLTGARILVEVDGGVWMRRGGHTTGTGYARDREKDAAAMVLGWQVYRCTPEMVRSGQALATITQLLGMAK